MLWTQLVVVVLTTAAVPCICQFTPGFGCNNTYLMLEFHKCEKAVLQSLINNPLANCSHEINRLQECSTRLITYICYRSLYAMYPKYRRAIYHVMDITLKYFNNALFYCSGQTMSINWDFIPEPVKILLPCKHRFFKEALACAQTFRVVFTANRKDPKLCRLYTEAKRCSHRLSYIYCSSSAAFPVNKLNPFCSGGIDVKEQPKNGSSIKCLVGVCAKSSSQLIYTTPCVPPMEVTCVAPPGSPFHYDMCMTTRLTVQPMPGVTVIQENRNCSSAPICQSPFYCNNANSTGVVQKCETRCCHGNLCNKDNITVQRPMKPTSPIAIGDSTTQCLSYTCYHFTSRFVPNDKCRPKHINCTSSSSTKNHPRCVRISILVESASGVMMHQERGGCSLQCNTSVLCNNNTGKSCDVLCCDGNLCNKPVDSEPTHLPLPTRPKGAIVKCMSHVCTTSSLNVPLHCKPAQEITCTTPSRSLYEYDYCMTLRISVEPFRDVTLERYVSSCASSVKCQEHLFCNAANKTGLVKSCNVNCCTGNLCNKAWLPVPKQPSNPITPGKRTQAGSLFNNCASLFKHKMMECNHIFLTAIVNEPLTCRQSFDKLLDCSNVIKCATMSPSQLFPFHALRKVFCHPLEGQVVPPSLTGHLQRRSADMLSLIMPCEFTFYSENLQCLKMFSKTMSNDRHSPKLCSLYKEAKQCVYRNAQQRCNITPGRAKGSSNPFCREEDHYQKPCKKGTWTTVTRSWITSHKWYGVHVTSASVNKGVIIKARVTSYGCNNKPGAGLTSFIKGNWTRIMYTQEFRGNTSCWRIFGNSGRKGGYKRYHDRSGLEEFNRQKGDLIFNQLRMGGSKGNTFKGQTLMCGSSPWNFWHAQNGQGPRRATVMLRRVHGAKRAGIHTATSCGLPSFVIKDIYVYHC